MSDSIGKVFLDLETNTGPFQKQLNGISGKATNMVKSAFAGIGKAAAAAFAVTKLVQFGKESINLASDLAEVQNVVDVVFGESSNQINNFAKSALTSYGLSELSAKQYASTMGAMLKSMGLTQDKVLDMSQAITALSGDMASFYNLDSDTAFQKIRAGISGETEPLKQLGINMSVANMEAFALEQGITKSYQKMSQSEQALLRYNYLLNTTADAQGDFARTSDSWANQTRILSEQFNSLKATLGSAFIAVLTPVVKMLNWIISKLQIAANWFKTFIEAITGKKVDIGSATGSAAESIDGLADSTSAAGDAAEKAGAQANKSLAGFDKLNVLSSSSGSGGGSGGAGGAGGGMDMSAFEAMELPEPDSTGAETFVAKVKGLFGDLMSYVTNTFSPSIQAWGDAFKGLKQPVIDTFTRAGTAVQGLWNEHLAPFAGYLLNDYMPSMVNSFSTTFAPIFTDVMSFALDEFASDFEFVMKQIGNFVTDIYQPALDVVKTVFVDVCGILKAQWDETGKKLLGLFGNVRDSVKGIWNNLYGSILKPVWQKIVGAVKDMWEKHLKSLVASVVSFASKVGEAIMTIWNNFLAPIVNWIIDFVAPKIKAVIDVVITVIKTVVGVVSEVVKGVFNALGGLLDFIIGVFTGDWDRAWTGIKTFFISIWNAIKNSLSTVWNGIKDILSPIGNWVNTKVVTPVKNFFSGMWNTLKTGASNAWTGIKNVFSTVATFFQNTFSNAWNKVKNIFSTGGKVFTGIKDGIVNAFKNIVNALIRGINRVISTPFNALNNVLSRIRNVSIAGLQPFGNLGSISVPAIPQLARGGIIDQPTLAMVGEAGKEAVVPLENTAFADAIASAILRVLTPLFANGSNIGKNDDGTTVIVLKVGEYELGRITVGAINKYHNVIGRVELEV